jgi:hypothetical protein
MSPLPLALLFPLGAAFGAATVLSPPPADAPPASSPAAPAAATPAAPLDLGPAPHPGAAPQETPVELPKETYDDAISRVLRQERLTRAEVEIVNLEAMEDEPDPRGGLVAQYGANRLVLLSRRTAYGAEPPPSAPSVLARDRRGRWVLLRAQPRQRTVYQQVDNCQGVQGVRATTTTYYSVAVLPKGIRVARTVVNTRPRECNNIP